VGGGRRAREGGIGSAFSVVSHAEWPAYQALRAPDQVSRAEGIPALAHRRCAKLHTDRSTAESVASTHANAEEHTENRRENWDTYTSPAHTYVRAHNRARICTHTSKREPIHSALTNTYQIWQFQQGENLQPEFRRELAHRLLLGSSAHVLAESWRCRCRGGGSGVGAGGSQVW
jgi:hypothetical protein